MDAGLVLNKMALRRLLVANSIDLSQVKWDAPQASVPVDLSQVKWDAPSPDQPVATLNPGSHPTFGPPQYNSNPFLGLLKGATQGAEDLTQTQINLEKKLGAKLTKGEQSFENAKSDNLIKPSMPGSGANIAENIGNTAVSSIPYAAGGMFGPLGMGAVGATEAYANNENVPLAFAKNAALGKLWQLGGSLGAKAFVDSAVKLGVPAEVASREFLKRAGSVAGGGLTGAATSQGDPSSIIQGAGFNAAFPSEPSVKSALKSGIVPEKSYDTQLNDLANAHRQILNPGKGEINNLEIKGNKDINDSMKLAAKYGLIYDKDSTGKLDTASTREQLQNVTSAKYNDLNNILDSNPEPQFDVEALGEKAKTQLSNPQSKTYIKNAKDLEDAYKTIDDEVGAEIARNGNLLTGSQLNTFKQGLWGKSYNLLAPNSKDVARQLGFVAKDAIEKAYPTDDVKGLNQEIGENLTLDTLLQKAHGRIVKAGRLGNYFAKITGAIIGSHGGPFGTLIGSELGGKASDFINDPTRISTALAAKSKALQEKYPQEFLGPRETTRPGVVTPEIVNPPLSKFSLNPFEKALPSPQAKGLGFDAESVARDQKLQEMQDAYNKNQVVSGENPILKIAPIDAISEVKKIKRPIGESLEPSTKTPKVIQGENPVKKLPSPETKYGEGFTAKDVTPDVKKQAQDQINNLWYKGMTGKDLPLKKDIGKKVAGIVAATALGAGIFGNQAQAKELPQKEHTVIQDVAQEYKLNPEQTKLLTAIRKAENGRTGREFGVLTKEAMRYKNDPEKSFKTQAQWAAGSIKKHYNGPQDLPAFAKRWAPSKVANDPANLNKNWLKNVRNFLKEEA